jgi:hypothetical protein
MRFPSSMRLLTTLAVASWLVSPAFAAADCPDGAPNVLFLVDTSGSMANVVWHPDFDPQVPTTCNFYASDTLYALHDRAATVCGTQRVYRVDPALEASGIQTRFDGHYLDWLHDLPDQDPRLAEIAAADSGTESECLGGGTYAAYAESRITAVKRFVRDVICRATGASNPRIGLARLREGTDPAGGYVSVPVDAYGPAQAALLEAEIDALRPGDWGPLGEALFQVSTYFMSRDPGATALGADEATHFQVYAYGTAPGGPFSTTPPPDPLASCEENLVIVVADDAPTRDDFDPDSSGTSLGFADFPNLVGNYNPDDVYPEEGTEEPAGSPTCPSGCEVALYLDDIAAFVHERDLRPDVTGEQTLRIYTLGVALEPFTWALLAKTAYVGGGTFFLLPDAAGLAAEIVAAGSLPQSVPSVAFPARAATALLHLGRVTSDSF